MASLSTEGERGERKRISFRDASGKQQTLRMGKCSKKNADLARSAIEHLLEAKRHDTAPHYDAQRWLERIDDRIHARVVALGLAQSRDAAVVTLGMLLDRFEESAVVKPATRAVYKQASGSLRAYLGESTPLSLITTSAADAWRRELSEPKSNARSTARLPKPLARATVAKRVHVAKTVFNRAVRWGLINTSPFAGVRAGSQSNPDRWHYVTRESIHAILDACPDDQWRAVIALSRFAGLRCPSEIVALKWGDVNWKRQRLTVRSSKTEAHEGHEVRVVPISQELLPILQSLFDRAEVGAERLVPRLRDATKNLRTTLLKIIAKAGLTPWPRLFQNMRSSCACDWVEQSPNHVAAGWLGHSPLIAARHYLQTRDAHFDIVTGLNEAAALTKPVREKATSNPTTHTLSSDHTALQGKTRNPRLHAELLSVGVVCDAVESSEKAENGRSRIRTYEG